MFTDAMPVGRFARVIKGDGTLLFKPFLRDADFLGTVKHLFHRTFGTEFEVSYIRPVAKGFHVRIAEVEKPFEAGYLVGEEFTLPRAELLGRSVDALIGTAVVREDGSPVGTVTDLALTPEYPLLTVTGPKKRVELPFIPAVARLEGDRIVLVREDALLD
ncbi:MAG TPA: PRC-barrel domain-containing protein [bacterium]|nr:PRC-barrel domain-containing protein [bacterium]